MGVTKMYKTLFVLPIFTTACSSILTSQDNVTYQKQSIEIDSVTDIEGLSLADLYDNTVLIQKKDNFDPSKVPHQNINITGKIPQLNVEQVSVPVGEDIFDFIEKLRKSDQFHFVEPNIIRQLDTHVLASSEAVTIAGAGTATVNDPYAYLQWHMSTMQVTLMGHDSQGDNIVVAVLDTGVSLDGLDTPSNMLVGYDFIDNDNNPSDFHGHGTHVAGTIAQATNNNVGLRGVAPNCSIMPVKVLDDDGFGGSHSIANGITFAVDNGADIINLSLVSSQSTSIESTAISYALANDVLVVAATGNDGLSNTVHYPAAYEGVIAVGSVGLDNIVTGYSNKGPELDFTAPGGDFNDDINQDGYSDGVLQETISAGAFNYYFFEGTSMATPHAAGAYAALMSSGYTASEITDAFVNTSLDMGNSGWDKDYGFGVIQLKDALDYLDANAVILPLDLDAFEVRYQPRHNKIEVHHYNPDAVSSILCTTGADGQYHCVERPSNPNYAEQYNVITNANPASFTFELVDADGTHTEFGPFSVDTEETNWQNEIICNAPLQLFNLEAATNADHTRINYTTSENLRVTLCGERSNGTTICQQSWGDGDGELTLWNAHDNITITLRNENGCSRNIGGLPDFISVLPQH
jgi:subtilisin family serine protease